VLILQQIVGTPVCRRFLGGDLRFVLDVPSGFPEQAIDYDSGISFSWHLSVENGVCLASERSHFVYEAEGLEVLPGGVGFELGGGNGFWFTRRHEDTKDLFGAGVICRNLSYPFVPSWLRVRFYSVVMGFGSHEGTKTRRICLEQG